MKLDTNDLQRLVQEVDTAIAALQRYRSSLQRALALNAAAETAYTIPAERWYLGADELTETGYTYRELDAALKAARGSASSVETPPKTGRPETTTA